MTAAVPAQAPEVLDAAEHSRTEGTKFVWQSRFGTIVIEVRDGRVYVDGALVERLEASPAQVGRSDASNRCEEAEERPAA